MGMEPSVRYIKKRASPKLLEQWRAPRLVKDAGPGLTCSYGELRRAQDVLDAVEDGLFAEQGGICAYTGQSIRLGSSGTNSPRREVGFHIEHLLPQKFCTFENGRSGFDADYQNLVACWPPPNVQFEPAYGARKKGDWPSCSSQQEFVSPLVPSCSSRFQFNQQGEIHPTQAEDQAAKVTIERLGLDNSELIALRKEAIRGALSPKPNQPLTRAQQETVRARIRQQVASLESGGQVALVPYCFVIESVLSARLARTKS